MEHIQEIKKYEKLLPKKYKFLSRIILEFERGQPDPNRLQVALATITTIWWNYICIKKRLSEEFIERYKNELDWILISTFQELSEQFIEKYANKVDWDMISLKQNLSPEFVVKHINRIKKSILKNKVFKTYPEPLKLLLNQKFGTEG